MRIYKGSEITLRLYNPCKIEDGLVDVILYTTNPKLAYKVKDATVEGNIVYVKIDKSTFNNMEDGVINYIILDEVYNTERQSSYYLKTPEDYVAKSVQTSKDIYIVDNGDYKVLPDEDYTSIEEVNVHVEFDAEPYIQRGFELGEENQKSKLESVSITENGTYSREDGYNEIHVEVPDLNGDYQTGYDEGYEAGIDYASENAGEIAAQTARVLDVTENGFYETQYSEPRLLTPITGKYPNGDNFYDYAYLNTNTGYNTGIFPGPTTKLEFWWKFDGTIEQGNTGEGLIIGSHDWGQTDSIFKVGFEYNNNKALIVAIGSTEPITIPLPDTEWHHYTVSYKDGIFIDDKKVGDFGEGNLTKTSTYHPMCINYYYGSNTRVNADYYGMVKIDDTIFIPTEEGFKNYTTNEFLPLVKKINYKYEYKKSDNINTGEYADGTPFYEYADIKDYVYNTEILPNETTKLEFWFKKDNLIESWANVIAASEADNNSFRIRQNATGVGGDAYVAQIKNSLIPFNMTSQFWYHIEMSYVGGLIINGIKIGDFTENISQYTTAPIFINGGQLWALPSGTDDGNFGMIKIFQDGVENIIIPTESGLKNITTNKYLQIVNNPYVYTQVEPEYSKPTGNLIKTVNVNVPPKIKNTKIKFGYSTFYEIPDGLIDWEKITDMNSMFRECSQLKNFGNIDTKNVETMSYAFSNTKINSETIAKLNTAKATDLSYAFYSTSITYFPSIDTSKVITFKGIFENSMNLEEVAPIDTSKATDLSYMFYNFSSEHKLRKLPEFDCTNVTSIGNMFSYYQDRMDYFTDCGGWKNLKINWNDNYGLRACANLTYQSCINILNGLYDFVGNGETPASNQGKLKVHQNFLNLVGDEISIGTNKGWTFSV